MKAATVDSTIVATVGSVFSLMGNYPQGWRCPILAQVDDVSGPDLEVDTESGRGGWRDVGEAKHESRRPIADELGAVEQFDLGCAGARGMDGEMSQHFLAQMLGDVGRAEGPAEAFAGEPDLCGGFLDLLAVAGHHEVDGAADLFRDALRRDGRPAAGCRARQARVWPALGA